MNTGNWFFEFDVHYYIILAHMNLITFASKINKTKDLAEKLHLNFVKPIFSIVKDKLMRVKSNIYLDTFCDNFSEKERSKINAFIRDNIDNFEILFVRFIHGHEHEQHIEHYKHVLFDMITSFYVLESLKYIYLLQKHIKNNKYHQLGLIEELVTITINFVVTEEDYYERSLLTNS